MSPEEKYKQPPPVTFRPWPCVQVMIDDWRENGYPWGVGAHINMRLMKGSGKGDNEIEEAIKQYARPFGEKEDD